MLTVNMAETAAQYMHVVQQPRSL